MQLLQFVITALFVTASADVQTIKTSDFQIEGKGPIKPTIAPSSRRPTIAPTTSPTRRPVSSPSRRPTTVPTIVPTIASVPISFNCPPKSYISEINANVGGVADRFNFRCNDAKHKQSTDIGTPIAFVTSPKSSVLKNSNGFDSISVGYAWYAPRGQFVVASLRICNGLQCQESFFLGLTICSADSTQTYACPTIHVFSAPTGQKITGIQAIHNPAKKNGFVKQLEPIFSQ